MTPLSPSAPAPAAAARTRRRRRRSHDAPAPPSPQTFFEHVTLQNTREIVALTARQAATESEFAAFRREFSGVPALLTEVSRDLVKIRTDNEEQTRRTQLTQAAQEETARAARQLRRAMSAKAWGFAALVLVGYLSTVLYSLVATTSPAWRLASLGLGCVMGLIGLVVYYRLHQQAESTPPKGTP